MRQPAPGFPRLTFDRPDAVLDHLPDAVIRCTPDGRVLYVNDAFVTLTGLPSERVVGRMARELPDAPEAVERLAAALAAALDTGEVITFTLRRVTPAGERYVEYRIIPERGADGVTHALTAIGRDVTELEAERARLTEAQRIARMGSWTWNVTTGESTATEELVQLLGAPTALHDPVGTLFSLLAPEDHPKLQERVRVIDEQRLTTSEGVWHIIRPDGESRHVHTRSVWTRDAEGRRVAGAGTFQDVTEQVEGAAALARQHAMLEESQRLARVGSWELDLATDAVTWSDEMYRLAGLSPGEQPPTRALLATMVHPDDLPLVRERTAQAIATGHAPDYEWRLVRPDGTTRLLHTRTRTTADAAGATVRMCGTCQDVTERRALEEEVRRAQKVEALGLLAGGIAHDFNNLLSAIIGGADLARLEVPDGSLAARDLDDVRQAAARAAQITRQLLAFSRRQARHPRVLDLRAVVRGTERLLRLLLPESMGLDVATAGEPVAVQADAAQLEQVVMNLVVNARDAILAAADDARGGAKGAMAGVVTVQVARTTLAAGDPRLARGVGAAVAAGDFAVLSVHDTGVGLDEATRARLFEPFFTTKEPGRGTGIGLATVLGIATQSGGIVDVESAAGAGATFAVLLPLVDAPVEGAMVGAAAPPSGTETILLVEDETVLRETSTRILQRHGYRVLAARHGGDALLLWRAHASEIQLLVTDVRMPELGGQALVDAVRAERPRLPVVVVSGYAGEGEPGAREPLARELFLAKPFTSEALLLHVRAALDGTGEPGTLR